MIKINLEPDQSIVLALFLWNGTMMSEFSQFTIQSETTSNNSKIDDFYRFLQP